MFRNVATDNVDMTASKPRRTSLLSRLLSNRRASVPSTSLLASRMEVLPPAAWGQAEPVWQTLWQRVRGEDFGPDRAQAQLDAARQDFADSLGDIVTPESLDLRQRALHARSLRELWHLRAELYSLVACQRSQSEAQRRVEALNRHFPVSTPQATRHSSLPRNNDRIA